MNIDRYEIFLNRRIFKNWIKKGNFEEAINFNPLQKSIGWLIS